MCKMQVAAGLIGCLVSVFPAHAQTSPPNPGEVGCLACHKGIEPIREAGSKMLAEIRDQGDAKTDPEGCCVCHGGDPTAKDKEKGLMEAKRSILTPEVLGSTSTPADNAILLTSECSGIT